ncbi:ECs1072 family phage-associated protein [Lelliottia nimipressuralis]
MHSHPAYYLLFAKYKEHVAQVRNISINGSVIYEQVCRVYYRAAQLTLLDVFLETYRQKHKSIFNDLRGKQALHHLLLTRYNWPLEKIRNLSLEDVFLILHDDLKTEKFDPAIAKYFDGTLCNYDQLNLPDIMDTEWKPEFAEELQ